MCTRPAVGCRGASFMKYVIPCHAGTLYRGLLTRLAVRRRLRVWCGAEGPCVLTAARPSIPGRIASPGANKGPGQARHLLSYRRMNGSAAVMLGPGGALLKSWKTDFVLKISPVSDYGKQNTSDSGQPACVSTTGSLEGFR